MKFKITKHREVEATNIFGKPADIYEYYTIDKVIFWLFHFSLEFNKVFKKTYVRYRPSDYATHFTTKEAAEEVLNDIYSNPNKYIRSI